MRRAIREKQGVIGLTDPVLSSVMALKIVGELHTQRHRVTSQRTATVL